MKVDVCICTRNRPEDLRRCIESAFASQAPVNRIIVADDSTNDVTASMLMIEYPKLVLIRGPRRGLGANRNAAIAAVEGDFILFLDDDALLSPDFIEGAAFFAEANNVNFSDTILTGVEINNGSVICANDQNFLGYQSHSYKKDEIKNTIVINATLIPSEIARRLHFDERLVYGSDEVDFAIRARASGVQIMFCSSISNIHFPSKINREYYMPFQDSSRIYVTFKRYCILDRNIMKSFFFLLAASLHLFAANIKRFGPRGILTTIASLQKAYCFVWHFLIGGTNAPYRTRP